MDEMSSSNQSDELGRGQSRAWNQMAAIAKPTTLLSGRGLSPARTRATARRTARRHDASSLPELPRDEMRAALFDLLVRVRVKSFN